MEVESRPAAIEVPYSLGLGLELVLWNKLEVCDARGIRWKYVGVYGSSWKLPRRIFVEAAIDGSNGSFHFHRQWKLPWKLPLITMEVNILPPTFMEVSMEINIIQRLPWKLP